MTEQQHPITPSPELLQQWTAEYWGNPSESIGEGEKYIAIQAARWGADQELEACCKTLEDIWDNDDVVTQGDFLQAFRAARRPKPPSLAEQAQRILVENGTTLDGRIELDPDDIITIRAALERLQELESKQ